jgi:hypothetical protein
MNQIIHTLHRFLHYMSESNNNNNSVHGRTQILPRSFFWFLFLFLFCWFERKTVNNTWNWRRIIVKILINIVLCCCCCGLYDVCMSWSSSFCKVLPHHQTSWVQHDQSWIWSIWRKEGVIIIIMITITTCMTCNFIYFLTFLRKSTC